MFKRSNNHKKKKIFLILICITLLFFMGTIYYRKITKLTYKNQVPTSNLIKKDIIKKNNLDRITTTNVDLDYYRKYYENEDIVGRLEIPNLINVFITQTTDNEYYLNHSIEKKEDLLGTEFMDFRVTENSQQINIYGHNSKTYKTAFRNLEKYLNEDFYKKNPYIIMQFNDSYKIYEITAIKEIKDDYEHMRINLSNDNFRIHVKKMQENALYKTDIPISNNSNILVLQTCSYNVVDSFYIIVAVEI